MSRLIHTGLGLVRVEFVPTISGIVPPFATHVRASSYPCVHIFHISLIEVSKRNVVDAEGREGRDEMGQVRQPAVSC